LDAVTNAVSKLQTCGELASSEWIHRARDDTGAVDEAERNKVSELVEELEDNEDCMRVWTTIDAQLRVQNEE
jgi:transcriptional/translational regulatory protein YebC/TACO1